MGTQRKLGTHNSMTYLSPNKEKPWMLLAWPLAKCQDLTYQQQYAFGVRAFDLRVRFNEETHTLVFAHGIVDFSGVYPKEVLDFLEEKADCVVNMVLENTSSIGRTQDEQFIAFCKQCEETYKHIQFKGGWAKFPDNDPHIPGGHPVIYSFKGTSLRIEEKYKQFTELNEMLNEIRQGEKVDLNKLWEAIKVFVNAPLGAAQKDNKGYWEEWLGNSEKESVCLMMDFVEIGAPDSWKVEHPYK
ncbi:hypothetical protein [Phocaeicola sp.]